MVLQWSHVFSDMVRAGDPVGDRADEWCFMEPCLFRHGKQEFEPQTSYTDDRLQWSHVFSDMVRSRRSRRGAGDGWLNGASVFSDMVRPQIITKAAT